jgi:aerobic-type carbon monoxide dehydrogenase small subunit (CoxS/CutS family)
MATDDDRDILDDEPASSSEPAQAPQEAPPATPAQSPPPGGASRRSFLIGAGAGAVAGVVVGGGIVGVANGVIPGGTTSGAVRTGGAPGGKAGEPVSGQVISVEVNGQSHELYVRANETVAEMLRQQLALTGTKIGCNRSECSACTVLLNGRAVNSCSELAIRTSGAKIVTVEGLEKDGKLSPVQAAFAKNMGMQCGFCTPGQIMQATALLTAIPNPSDAQIMHQMAGNLCKCSAYPNIMASVKEAAKTFRA